MRRTAMAFMMLAGLGGCTPLDPDPAEYPGMSRRTTAATRSWQRSAPVAGGGYVPADPGDTKGPPLGPYGPYPPKPATASSWGTKTAPAPDYKPNPAVVQAKPAPPPVADSKDSSDEEPGGTLLPMAYSDKPSTTVVKDPLATPRPAAKAAGKALVVELDQGPVHTVVPGLRMVNSKQIAFNFEVKDVGPSGVSTIELWCTRDGRSWKKYSAGARDCHALVVQVKDEGMYGFTLLARNGSGQGKDAPASGDPPQVWVLVDLTKPAVQLTGFELRRTPKDPQLTVHWKATDKNLAPRPISVSYAEQAGGPWHPVAGGLANSGKYSWPITPCVPQRFYVRVEAVDTMGNVGVAQTSKPVRIELSPPVPKDTTANEGPITLPPLSSSAGLPPAIDTSKPTVNLVDVDSNGN